MYTGIVDVVFGCSIWSGPAVTAVIPTDPTTPIQPPAPTPASI